MEECKVLEDCKAVYAQSYTLSVLSANTGIGCCIWSVKHVYGTGRARSGNAGPSTRKLIPERCSSKVPALNQQFQVFILVENMHLCKCHGANIKDLK